MTELLGPPLAGTPPWTALLSEQSQTCQLGHCTGASTTVQTGRVISHLAVLLLDQALGFLDFLVELLDVTGLGL